MKKRWLGAAALLWVVAPASSISAQVASGHRSRVTRVEVGLRVQGQEQRYDIAERMEHYRVPGVSVALGQVGAE